jgi:heterodisulfide reductase subunit A
VILSDGKPTVECTDPVLQTPLEIEPSLLLLATGIAPDSSNAKLAQIFDLKLDRDGFFHEPDGKWRPVELSKMGVFAIGTAHSPQPVNEAMMQAEAAAHRTYSYLAHAKLDTPRVVSRVHDALCTRCQLCIEVCPFEARWLDETENRIVVDPAACQACGACAVACRNNATEVLGWSDKQVMAVIDAKLRGDIPYEEHHG